MTEHEILQVFRDTGALLEGHFIVRSGLHSRQYFQCALALQVATFEPDKLPPDVAVVSATKSGSK